MVFHGFPLSLLSLHYYDFQMFFFKLFFIFLSCFHHHFLSHLLLKEFVKTQCLWGNLCGTSRRNHGRGQKRQSVFLSVVSCICSYHSHISSSFSDIFSQVQCWFRQSGQTSSRNTPLCMKTIQYLTTSTISMPRLQGEEPMCADALFL